MQIKDGWTAKVLIAAGLAVAVSGCQKAATGQVAAVVNGDEVSLQELNAEVSGAKVPEGADKDRVRAEALQRIIERRLLAQQAKTAGLDRDPDYLLRKRQLDEALLVQLYAKKAQDTLRVPDPAAITRYIADHPTMFAGRTIYTVDQIRFPNTQDKSIMPALASAHSQAEVAAALKQRNIPFDHGVQKVDSAQIPPVIFNQIKALPPGEPFVVPSPAGVMVSVITGAEPMPLPDAQSRPVAVQTMRNEELTKLLDQRLKEAKGTAKIEYQSGFGPPKPDAKPSPKAAPAKM